MGYTKSTSKAGNGALPKKGDNITVHCTGIVSESGKKFWSTKDPGQEPFSFRVGMGQVIRGRYSARSLSLTHACVEPHCKWGEDAHRPFVCRTHARLAYTSLSALWACAACPRPLGTPSVPHPTPPGPLPTAVLADTHTLACLIVCRMGRGHAHHVPGGGSKAHLHVRTLALRALPPSC